MCRDVYSKQLKETYKERVSRQADPLTSLPLSHAVSSTWSRKCRGRDTKEKEVDGVHQKLRKEEKVKDGSFKHTQAGIACQNTLPSSNWVIFDTPCCTVPAYWWGGVRVPRACEASLAPNQSRHKRCPQTIWQARAHTGARTSKNMAPQLPPVPPGRNWYMGIPEHFQRRELNPHVYYEIGYFVPASPLLPLLLFFSPSPSLQPYHRFSTPNTSCFSHSLSVNYQLPLYLSLWNRPRFDHDVLGCEGGQGCLIFTWCSAWQDFTRLSLFVAVLGPVCVRVSMFVCTVKYADAHSLK